MKIPSLLVIAFSLTALSLPAFPHPGHADAPHDKAFLVSWIGIAPATPAGVNPASCPDFYKKAFISKYATLGATALP